MPGMEPVGAISRPSNSYCGENDGPQFIRFVDERQPEINEIWTFGEDGVTPKFHLTARIDVSNFVGGYFFIEYLNQIWSRVPMFGQKSINGNV